MVLTSPLSLDLSQSSQYTIYGSKRDLWEKQPAASSIPPASGFRKNSIFDTSLNPISAPFYSSKSKAISPVPPSASSTPTSTSSGTVTDTAIPIKRSRNAIFDVPQVIPKPAIKMTPEELEKLKTGDFASYSSNDNLSLPTASPITSITPTTSMCTPPTQPLKADHSSSPFTTIPATPRTTQDGRSWLDSSSSENNLSTSSPVLEIQKSSYPTAARHSKSDMMSLPSLAAVNSSNSLKKKTSTPEFSQSRADGGVAVRSTPGLAVITNPGHAFDNIHLSFLPTRKNFLGEGRYGRVYLGQYTVHEPAPEPQKDTAKSKVSASNDAGDHVDSPVPLSAKSSTPHDHFYSNPEFKTCAVKRLHSSPECQAIGFAELFILRRIGTHPHIVSLIGAKDETDLESAAYKKRTKSSVSDLTSPLSSKPLLLPFTEETASPRLLLLLGFEPGGNMWDYIEANKDVGIGKATWLKWSI
ncbi:hypothetical protein HDV05_007877, partial [Chytridiales sp. JEL 0842]